MVNLRCKICGYKAKSPQGLFGHVRLKHTGGEYKHEEHSHKNADEVLDCPFCGPAIVRRLIQRWGHGDESMWNLVWELGYHLHTLPFGNQYEFLAIRTRPDRELLKKVASGLKVDAAKYGEPET